MLLNGHKPTILIFGDLMLDHQINGTIDKLANEAPIPVLHQTSEIYSLGGCGNVLLNLHSLQCKALYLFSSIGCDQYGAKIKEIISRYPTIQSELYESSDITTIVKTRGFCDRKMIFRYDIEQPKSLLSKIVRSIVEKVKLILATTQVDSIVFSDYNKGFLTKELCQEIIKLADTHSIFTCVDPKKDYTKYIGCTLIKPNRNEISTLFNKTVDINHIIDTHTLIKKLVGCQTSLITLAEKGMSMLTSSDELLYQSTESNDVIDVTGAGDVVTSVISYYYSQISNKQDLLKLATFLGSKSVQHSGTYQINSKDLMDAYSFIKKDKLISVTELISFNQPIVFTNGCFDILHKGHLELFEYCNGLCLIGQKLVVAINSDESIKRLKGSERPINSLESRISMLSALKWIDWILVFNEDTPYEVLQQLKPSILVKGGDYIVETIIGKEFCSQVKIFSTVGTYSTTNIINCLKKKL